jgi:Clostripain family
MVFMGVETFDGSDPLDEAAEADLQEISSVFTVKADQRDVGKAGPLNVYVQVQHSATVARRYHFGFDPQDRKTTATEEQAPKEEPEPALIGFIEHSIRESGHQPDDHSMLVLWGHAYDFAFGRSRTRTGVVDAIDFVELRDMLLQLQARFSRWYQSAEPPTLDIIGFDACDAATVEMACQLQPFAKYLLGSEIGIPIPGWPYDRILDRLRYPKDAPMTPPEFGSYVVRRFCESYPASSPVSLTFIGLAQANELRYRAELLALALLAAIGDSDRRHRIMELFTLSQTGEDRPYVDVADLCLNLVRYGGDPLIAEMARTLGDLLLTPRFSLVGRSATGEGRPLIMDHGRNAGELARLNGISLYAPHVAFGTDFDAVRGLYDGFVFAKETKWSRLVHTLAKLS